MARNLGLVFWAVVFLGTAFGMDAGAAPSLVSLSPDYGSGAGGTVVAIQATGLSVTGVTRVLFDAAEASAVQVSDSGGGNFSLVCKTPPHWGGLSRVTVVNPDLSSTTLADAYVFVPTTFDPGVSGALPCSSPTAGGRTIFVLGQEAGLPFSQYTLTIGGVPITGVREYRVPGCIPLYSGIAPAQPQGLVGFGVVGYGQLLGDCFIHSDWTGPLILSCSPGHDWDSGGAEVHIIAGNLSLAGTPTVAFGGVAAANVVVHPDFGGYITCTAPPHAAGMADIVVTNPGGQSGTLSGWFTYDQTQTPVPVSVSPGAGPGYLNNHVTIAGSGFSPAGGATQVTFGGVQASSVFVASATSLSCYTPEHAAGAVDVVVINPEGTAGTLADGYTFLPPITPVPTAVTPNMGQEAGGIQVTITGAGFTPLSVTRVSFGGLQANQVRVQDAGDGTYQILCQTPGHAPGPVDVVVTNPGNASGTLADGFTYLPQTPPNPVSVTPGDGSTLGGAGVTIFGTGFTPNRSMRVSFGDAQASDVQVVDDRTITCTTPTHSAGTVDVAVIASDDSAGVLAGGFTYVDAPPPRIDSVTRPLDLTTGGALVTIAGAGFSTVYSYPAATRVLFGGVEAFDVSVTGESGIQCHTPVHLPGVVDVEVVNPDGKTGILAGGFTYVDAAPPCPLTIAPAHGLTLGGTGVSVGGTDFSFNSHAPVRVLFGGVDAANAGSHDAYGVGCKTPPHAPGPVDVVVVNSDGKTGVIPGGFTYLSTMPPVLSSIDPGIGFATGGNRVTIYGTDLSESGITRVTFGGVESPSVSVYAVGDGTLQINCQVPQHTPGTVDVTVYNPGGGEATLAGAYIYIPGPPPGIQRLLPDTGPSAGGTPTILTGRFFGELGAIRVSFGGAEAAEVRRIAADTLFCVVPPHDAGTVDVTVTNTDGQTGTLKNAYAYRPPAGSVIHVDPDNLLGAQDGLSWETAFTSIQAGIDAATATGEPGEVWVAGGTYTTTGDAVVALAPFCDVYGGFAGTETARGQRDFKAHVSVIDGEDAHACVYGADNARLDGFVITRGSGPGHAGASQALYAALSAAGSYSDFNHMLAVDNIGVSPIIANCTVTGNTAGVAAMVNVNNGERPSCPLITGCSFTDNKPNTYAVLNGSVFGSFSSPRIENSSFAGNWVGVLDINLEGGACLPRISGCTFSANTNSALMSGALQGTCKSLLENCLFTRHEHRVLVVGWGPMGSGTLQAVNCTFAGNPTRKYLVDNNYYGSGAQVRLSNAVVWGNGGALGREQDVSVLASFSDIEGGFPGTGNINADPLFADAEGGDYRLRSDSPCVDTGTANGAPVVDLLGVVRPQRAGYDMGAYELPEPVPAIGVIGLTLDEASETLVGAGFTVGKVGYQYSLAIPAGVVVSQSPIEGADVLPDFAVDLVLSRGGLAVPDVVGKPQVAAAAALGNDMLTVGTVTGQCSATVPAGMVMEQCPPAGAAVLPGTPVDLTVSSGVQPIFMPDILAQPKQQAEEAVTAAGLVLGAVTECFSDAVAAGAVVSQSPVPGVELPPGTAVSLVVSLGPAPQAEGEPAEGEDGLLDVAGAQQRLAAALQAADANGDGGLSLQEAAAVPELTQALFEALDANGDGQLTPGELGVTPLSGCTGCRGVKGDAGTVGFGRHLDNLFLTVLGTE